jgi:hypothetical protein
MFHFEQKDAASGGPQHDQIRMCVNGARMDADVLKSPWLTEPPVLSVGYVVNARRIDD